MEGLKQGLIRKIADVRKTISDFTQELSQSIRGFFGMKSTAQKITMQHRVVLSKANNDALDRRIKALGPARNSPVYQGKFTPSIVSFSGEKRRLAPSANYINKKSSTTVNNINSGGSGKVDTAITIRLESDKKVGSFGSETKTSGTLIRNVGTSMAGGY